MIRFKGEELHSAFISIKSAGYFDQLSIMRESFAPGPIKCLISCYLLLYIYIFFILWKHLWYLIVITAMFHYPVYQSYNTIRVTFVHNILLFKNNFFHRKEPSKNTSNDFSYRSQAKCRICFTFLGEVCFNTHEPYLSHSDKNYLKRKKILGKYVNLGRKNQTPSDNEQS